MISVKPARIRRQLHELWNDKDELPPTLWSAIEGAHPAIAFCDQLESPQWCLLRSSYSGRTFAAGDIDRKTLQLCIRRLRRSGPLHINTNLLDTSMFVRAPAIRQIEFFERTLSLASETRLLSDKPFNAEIQQVTAELFPKLMWKQELVRAYGSSTHYVKRSCGFALVKQGKIISEAHAFFWGKKYVDIGTTTDPAYRGVGASAICCMHLINSIEKRGFRPYWCCDANNVASAAVARKLGFYRGKESVLTVVPEAFPIMVSRLVHSQIKRVLAVSQRLARYWT